MDNQEMFFIAGIQPKTKILDRTPRRCSHCGMSQARLKRIDHYVSLFFIPLLRVKKGAPVVVCDRCGGTASTGKGPPAKPDDRPQPLQCRHCGHLLERDFKYCPSCGRRI